MSIAGGCEDLFVTPSHSISKLAASTDRAQAPSHIGPLAGEVMGWAGPNKRFDSHPMVYLTDWRILLAYLLLVLAIATMFYRSEKR